MSTNRNTKREEKRFNEELDKYLTQVIGKFEFLTLNIHTGKFDNSDEYLNLLELSQYLNTKFNRFIDNWNKKTKIYRVEHNRFRNIFNNALKNELRKHFIEAVSLFANEKYGILFHHVTKFETEINQCIENGFTPEEASVLINKRVRNGL